MRSWVKIRKEQMFWKWGAKSHRLRAKWFQYIILHPSWTIIIYQQNTSPIENSKNWKSQEFTISMRLTLFLSPFSFFSFSFFHFFSFFFKWVSQGKFITNFKFQLFYKLCTIRQEIYQDLISLHQTIKAHQKRTIHLTSALSSLMQKNETLF